LRRPANNNRIAGHRSDLFRMKLVSYGKNQLRAFMLRYAGGNGTEYVSPAIQYCAHRCINQRFTDDLWSGFCSRRSLATVWLSFILLEFMCRQQYIVATRNQRLFLSQLS
jgi:hypothetical protein